MKVIDYLPGAPTLHPLWEITKPPKRVFYEGNSSLLELPRIAVVGTRRPSAYGKRAARILSQQLSELGICVVSGLAYGIDSSAHHGALQGGGNTIAVLAHGLDTTYPRGNSELRQNILNNGGGVLTEYPLGQPPHRGAFPCRNRIISGLSLGVIIVEAAPKSGSLITAKWALEQNREVFCVPGAFDDFGFSGSHSLLQQGAKLVDGIPSILEEFPRLHSALQEDLEESSPLMKQLEGLMQNSGGEVTLGNLMESWSAPTHLWEVLETAQKLGKIQWTGPQQLVWVR